MIIFPPNKRKGQIQVTLCAAAYQELDTDKSITVELDQIENIVAVDPELGIGHSIIFLFDGQSLNVLESITELHFGDQGLN